MKLREESRKRAGIGMDSNLELGFEAKLEAYSATALGDEHPPYGQSAPQPSWGRWARLSSAAAAA
jgi:hypothetical protein